MADSMASLKIENLQKLFWLFNSIYLLHIQKNIVNFVPMDNLTSEILLDKFNNAMKDLAAIGTSKIIGISINAAF